MPDVMGREASMLVLGLAVAAGGALGAVLRWGASCLLNGFGPFPFGTLAVNLTGAFLIGFLIVYFSSVKQVDQTLYLFLVTGCLGALTTFSTFSAENVSMMLDGQYLKSLMHAASHLFGSFAMTALGMSVAKAFLG